MLSHALRRIEVAVLVLIVAVGPFAAPAGAGPYVTQPSSIRWNDVTGVRWSDASGLRWSDASGLRWDEVGGVRWSDASGFFWAEADGVRWSDASGVRWSDASGLTFGELQTGNPADLDLQMLNLLSTLPNTSAIGVVVTYRHYPTAVDLAALSSIGIMGGTLFHRLPMVMINATKPQIALMANNPAIRSIYSNRTLSIFDRESRALIGADEAQADLDLALPGGFPVTGAGVTIATLDTGVDATHPDLPYGTKVIQNVRLNSATGTGIGFSYPTFVAGLPNTDLVMGHGTFVSSVAAGSGAASGGRYRGIAPGAKILGLSAGDIFIVNMLEGFDYILDHASQYGVRVVNCSWGTDGWFDPDDPINIATQALYDSGINVVFAAGNYGPAPDTLNPYSVAPWVIGVASVRKDGTLSEWSSRGIYEELLYHPLLAAPGEGIIAAASTLLGGVNGVTGVTDPSGGTTVPPQDLAHYTVSSGTSFAAPHVAGVIALMLERNPSLTPAQVKTILQKTSTPMLDRDRYEAGAGRVDVWSALTSAIDAGRPFGTHYAGWLDQRPFSITHAAPIETQGVYPAGGGTMSVPLSSSGATVFFQASLAWGTLPGGHDLDIVLRDGAGRAVARSDAFNGASLFGRTEGVTLVGSVPASLTLEISSKAGGSAFDQTFYLHQESATVTAEDMTDLSELTPDETQRVALALARRVMIGRGDRFEPQSALTRAELARALALAAGSPQRVPAVSSFTDVSTGDPAYPYIESASGVRARGVLIDAATGGLCIKQPCPLTFAPASPATRLDFAIGAVRAIGRDTEARQRAGETLDLWDASDIPTAQAGYVAIALEEGLIAPVGGALPVLKPAAPLSRLEAARYLLRLVDLRRDPEAPPASVPDPSYSNPDGGKAVGETSRKPGASIHTIRTISGSPASFSPED